MGKHGGTIVNAAYPSRQKTLHSQRKRKLQQKERADKKDKIARGEVDTWIQCNHCLKWRKVPPDYHYDKKYWYCCFHPDYSMASCSVPQQDWTGNNEEDEDCKEDEEDDGRAAKAAQRRKDERHRTRAHLLKVSQQPPRSPPPDIARQMANLHLPEQHPTVVCLHCGVCVTMPGADIKGTFTCPVSGNQQAYHRVQQGALVAQNFKIIDQCCGRVMHFLELPTSSKHGCGHTRDISRSAVLANGYDSSSGDDDGMEHIRDDSLWDDDGNWLGSDWDKSPFKYVPMELRNPPRGRIIMDDSNSTGILRPVHTIDQQWYDHGGSDGFVKWYQEHY